MVYLGIFVLLLTIFSLPSVLFLWMYYPITGVIIPTFILATVLFITSKWGK